MILSDKIPEKMITENYIYLILALPKIPAVIIQHGSGHPKSLV